MRLLILSPYLPSPPRSGGAARIHGLASRLARRHEVAILAYARPGEDLSARLAATGAYASEIRIIESRRVGASARQRRAAQLLSLLSRQSYERRAYASAGFQAALDEMTAAWRPDAILIEFAQMGYFRFPEGNPLILDAHNVEHELLLRMAAGGSALRRIYRRINAARLRTDEARLLRRVDAAAATSPRDRDLLRALAPGARIEVVPNGVDTTEYRPLLGASYAPPTILFFGAMDYSPNIDAALRFHRTIWPRLRARWPRLRFAVVGREPPAAVRALNGRDGVVVTGQVEDLRPWLADAAVVVVPLRFGSGTRLKVLEALAMARPVVSTSAGIEGLAVENGRHLLVADRRDEFASAVELLLSEPELAERLGRAGRRLVEQCYDWGSISERLDWLISEAVAARRG